MENELGSPNDFKAPITRYGMYVALATAISIMLLLCYLHLGNVSIARLIFRYYLG